MVTAPAAAAAAATGAAGAPHRFVALDSLRGVMASVVPVAWAAWRSIEWPARAWSRRLAARIDGARNARDPLA